MDGTESPGVDLSVSVRHVDGHADVALAGELDLSTRALLRATVDRLIADGHRDLRINASQLRFLDASGVGALLDSQQRLRELGGDLTLYAIHDLPLRTLTVCGLFEAMTEPSTRQPWPKS